MIHHPRRTGPSLVSLFALLAMLLSACGAAPTTPSAAGTGDAAPSAATVAGAPTAPAAGAPKMGGKLTMSLADSDLQNWDPIVPTDNMSIWTMLQVYDQILRVGPDGTSMEPGLAEKYTVSDDGKTYTFVMRQGVTFHDGTPLAIEDLQYVLERGSDKKSSWSWIFPKIAKMTTPDEKTLVVELEKPWAPFLADLGLFAASVIPKKQHQQLGDKFFDKPNGTGPFVFDTWERGNKIVLKKNPSYWNKPYPYLDEVEFQVLTDDNSRMLKFQGGELDVATNVPFNQIAALKNDTSVDMQLATVAQINMVVMNHKRKPFDDKNVRLAVNMAIDRKAMIDSVLFGNAKIANTQLPPMLHWSDKVAPHPFDVAKAKELLAQSPVPTGFKTTLTVPAGNSVDRAIATIMQDQLKQIGIAVEIIEVDAGIAYQTQQDGNFDMITGYYTTDIIDPDELTAFGIAPAGGTSAFYSFYTNDKLDRLAQEASGTMDEGKRDELYQQIQQINMDDAVNIPLYYPLNRTAVKTTVKGFKVLPTSNYRLWEVWLDK